MADLSKALEFVLPNEGGYSNNPADKGGETMRGITEATARAYGYTGNMADLPLSVTTQIYGSEYWPGLESVTSQAVASKIMDLRVNFGVSGGNRIAQEAVNQVVEPPVAVDGRWGPDTLDAVNSADPKDYLQALADMASSHYRGIVAEDPSQGQFLTGWLKRAAKVPGLVAGGVGLLALLVIGGGLWIFGGRGRS